MPSVLAALCHYHVISSHDSGTDDLNGIDDLSGINDLNWGYPQTSNISHISRQ